MTIIRFASRIKLSLTLRKWRREEEEKRNENSDQDVTGLRGGPAALLCLFAKNSWVRLYVIILQTLFDSPSDPIK